ncbi:MAG: DUF5060 domain-containing protein [Granulosicoccus sp.]
MTAKRITTISLLLCLLLPFQSHGASSSHIIRSGQWNQIIIPADPDGKTLTDLFGDELNVQDYERTWIVWWFDSATGGYQLVKTDDPLSSKEGYWIIQITNADVTLTLPDNLPTVATSSTTGCLSSKGCIRFPLTTTTNRVGWSILGSALDLPVAETNFTFIRGQGAQCLNGCSIQEAYDFGLAAPSLYWYDPDVGDYLTFSDSPVLEPWQAGWYGTQTDPLGESAQASMLVELPDQCGSATCEEVIIGGQRKKWHPLTLDVSGPSANETDVAPNPFLDVRLVVTMTAPSGNVVDVPGFFAGNGSGGGTGNVWRTRFAPDESGTWSYSISFRQGDDLAISNGVLDGDALSADGVSGSFVIAERDSNAPGLLADGRLEYIGEHYLKQRDGSYWIKGGVDSPENFFGYAGFDNTEDQSGGAGTNGLQDGIHRFEPHRADWNSGDPNFTSTDTGVDGKGIIGAVNYLSEQSVNSIYFLPMNLGGDGRETYPFVGPSGSDFDNTHYDVSKLYQWNIVLDHMQRKGISAHMVLAETENGNTNWLDNGQLGLERKLYYRELIARFSYLNGVKWNLSEESGYGRGRHIVFARYIRSLDWADHQIAVHTRKDQPGNTYNDLLGQANFDTTSIQFSPGNADNYVETWRKNSSDAGVKWVVEMDENGPASTGLTDTNADALRASVLYPTLFSGGHIEWYFGYHDLPLGGDMRTENFRTRQSMFTFMAHARKFMIDNLPFWEMSPNDDALTGGNAGDQVFEKRGQIYALYLQNGTAGRALSVVSGSYSARWFNPRNGQFSGATLSLSGTSLSVGASPAEQSEDWVVLISRH